MKAVFLAPGLLAPLLLLVSCESPLPRHDAFEHFFDQYDQISAPDLEKLDADYAAGALTDLEYQRERTILRGNVQQKVNDLVFHNHRLRENDAQRLGLPISGASVNTPSTGRGYGNQRGAGAAGATGGAAGIGGGGFGGLGGASGRPVTSAPAGPRGLVY